MDDIIAAIKSLLSAGLGASAYKYVYGEVKVPSDADLPLIEIVPVSTSMEIQGTGGMRKFTHRIDITLKLRLQDYLQNNTNVTELSHMRQLVKVVEERESNYTLKAATILGILSTNLKLSSTAKIVNAYEANYRENEYGNKWIVMATCSITVIQLIP